MDRARDRFVAGADHAMVVVTAATAGQRAGCLVGFHSQSSIEPWRYTVYLSTKNATWAVARRAEHLMVHLLDATAGGLAHVFGELTADDGVDKFDLVPWRPGPDGRTPLLSGVHHWMFGRIERMHAADGDHSAIVLSEVRSRAPAGQRSRPLRLHDVDDYVPGHPA